MKHLMFELFIVILPILFELLALVLFLRGTGVWAGVLARAL